MTSMMQTESKRSKNASAKKAGKNSRRGRKSAAPRELAKHGQFFKGYVPPISGVSGSPFKVARTWAMAGQEDVELVRMRYETTSAFTATGGAASYLQIKGNSIYRPYPGNTDSPAGYQRLYTQYATAIVLGSRVTVRLWSDTGAGVQQPFRIAAVPCTSAQYTIYSAYSNIAALRGVPHATEQLFSPGAAVPTLKASGTTAQVLLGFKNESAVESLPNAGFSAASGADPSTLWYHLIGLQAMAGTTTLNAQLQVLIEFDVMFRTPVATAVQSLSINKWGNEEVRPAVAEEHKGEFKNSKALSKETEFELVELPQARPRVQGAGVESRSSAGSAATAATENLQAGFRPSIFTSPGGQSRS